MTFGKNEHFVIRKAAPADLDAIKNIADAHRCELGFVLRPALAEAIGREEILVAENHQGLVGFVEYHHRRDDQTTLYHIAVHSSYRRLGAGRALVNALCDEAMAQGKRTILLKCPVGLPAHGFYSHLNFRPLEIEEGNGRPLVIWTFSLALDKEQSDEPGTHTT